MKNLKEFHAENVELHVVLYHTRGKTIEFTEEKDDFERAKRKGESALRGFMMDYPESSFREEALAEIERIREIERGPELARQQQASEAAKRKKELQEQEQKALAAQKQKEIEQLANPILKRAYESGATGASNMDDDFLGEDLDGTGPTVEEVD